MKKLSEKQIEKAFEAWNKEFVNDPKAFCEEISDISEAESRAKSQTKALFNYAEKEEE